MYIHGGDIYTNENMLDFSANINPCGMPDSIRQAAIKGVWKSENYPQPQARRLCELIGEYYRLRKECIVCGNGAAELLFAMAHAIKPKKALIYEPSFFEYEQSLCSCGCEILFYNLQQACDFGLGQDYLQMITSKIDMIYLCNPNNPTGALIPKDFLNKILRKCKEHDVWMIVDECFLDFVEEQEKYSLIEETRQHEKLVILKAFTKIFAMPGLRLGYLLSGSEELADRIRAQLQPWNISLPAMYAAETAMKEMEYVAHCAKIIAQQRNYLWEELEKLDFRVYKPSANYIFFKGPKNLADDLKKHHILIRDCSNYRNLTDGYYRIAVRTKDENQRLLETIKKIRT
ncbi:threonine-phosphate decarboxylase CobD [Eubacterium oxidoreducens]|uniref:threonine-phosphate decarboxylase n=1 Tax=Eubacterium oxidoreducens TaxID=1732 RepID=A0A1G6BI84_EUBOX|nr:threonine-phosphate decarboxylase CobD [Eubacterium oxidoreducens]SDB20288.1 L-threonine O-3-phosphate decarboxylase [Eubacterium oxidoreducens]